MKDDLIRRSDVVDFMTAKIEGSRRDSVEEAALESARDWIENKIEAPAALWKIVEEEGVEDAYGNPCRHAECTACGFTWQRPYDALNYFKCCPGCGVKI